MIARVRAWLSGWIADDPNPQYTRVDGWDRLR